MLASLNIPLIIHTQTHTWKGCSGAIYMYAAQASLPGAALGWDYGKMSEPILEDKCPCGGQARTVKLPATGLVHDMRRCPGR